MPIEELENQTSGHRRAASVLVAIALMAFAPAVAAEANPFFTFRLEAKAEADVKGDEASVRVPIQLKTDVSLDDLSVTKAEVRLGATSSQSIRDAFDVTLATGPDDLGPAFTVKVDLSGELRAGTYKVATDVTGPEGVVQKGDFQVVIPSAVLESSLPKLVITRVLRPLVPDLVRPSTLTLSESGDKSRLRPRAQQVVLADKDGLPTAGEVVLRMPSVIDRGQGASVEATLTGEPPLGTASGKIRIQAPELAVPAFLDVAINTRRSYFWIFAFLIAGLGVGYEVRVRLQAGAELKQAEIEAQVLRKRMHEEAAKAENRSIAVEIRRLMQELQSKIDVGDAKQIAAQVPKSDEAFRALVDGLAKRKAKAQTAHKTLRALVEKTLQLPDEVKRDVTTAKERLPEVAVLLEASDFKGASERVAEIREQLVQAAQVNTDEWRDRAQRPFDRLLAESSVLHGVIKSALGGRWVQPALQALDSLPIDAASPTTAEALLDAVHKAARACAHQTDQQFDKLVAFCDVALDQLREAEKREVLRDPVAVERFAERYAPLRRTSEQATSYETALEQLLAEHDALSSSLQTALANQLAEVKPQDLSDEAKLRNALDQLKHLPPRTRAVTRGEGELLGAHPFDKGLASSARSASRRVAEFMRQLAPPRSGDHVPADAEAPRLPPHPAVLEARSTAELRRLKRRQWLFSAAIIALVGFFLYQPSFVGTWQELAKIFFWGFGLDLGFDKVLGLATRVK